MSSQIEIESQISDMLGVQCDSQVKLTVDQQHQQVEELKCEIQQKYPQAYINASQISDQVHLITFPLEIHVGILITIFELLIDYNLQSIQVHAYFTNKNGRLIVKEKLLRLSVCRYMLRLNNNLRVGSFFLNPIFGHVGFNLNCQNNASFFQQEQNLSEFLAYLDSLIITVTHSLRFHFMRILFMLNIINIKLFRVYESYMEKFRYQEEEKNRPQNNPTLIWRKFPKDVEILLQRIKKVVKNNMHLEFSDQQYESYGQILEKQVTTDSKCLLQIQPNDLNALEVDQTYLISEGGFCNIFSKEIYYYLYKNGQQQQQSQKRPLVIKTDKFQQGDKVKKEIEVVSRLSEAESKDQESTDNEINTQKKQQQQQQQQQQFRDQETMRLKFFKFTGCCPYIAQFYHVPQKPDIVLMERYYHSSLDYFKTKQSEVLSLSTRIFIAHSIAMGLRYIHNYGVIHMDIKSANILISKTLMAKITDFGEAIIKNKIGDKDKPGKTMPFCAPEIQQKLETSKYTYAYDIYSFGVLLFELLFDRYPIDFRRQNLKPLEEKLQKLNYAVRYDENVDKFVGPQVIMKYLGRMCQQCLQPDPANRPNIDKIVLVLKDCLTYLDKVY